MTVANRSSKSTPKSSSSSNRTKLKVRLEGRSRTKKDVNTVCSRVAAVRFFWENLIEDLSRLENEEGSGCILAHCMGLGKTLSVRCYIINSL